MFKLKYVWLSLFLMTINVSAKSIKLDTSDDFSLAADYVAAKEVKGGVLMLHQCNSNKGMYQGLAKSLSKKGISSLSLDFRSYGESVSETVSLENFRKNSKDRQELRSKIIAVRKHWPADVEQAYQFLVKQVGDKPISFIGASCGGGQALVLAQKHKPQSFIFFSSGMDNETQELYQKVSDVPAMIIAAEGDEYTFKSSNEIYKKKKTDLTQLKTYKGNGHGFPLFKQDPNLEKEMVNWFVKFTK